MTDRRQTLFVGLGSPHGDDQIGWLVADRLLGAPDLPAEVAVRKAAVPLDLFDWLEGVDCLHVCDACQEPVKAGSFRHWEWNDGTKAANAMCPPPNRVDNVKPPQAVCYANHSDGKRNVQQASKREVAGERLPASILPSECNPAAPLEFLPELARLRCRGSHDFGLSAVLDLAAQLNRRPRRISIWAISGRSFEAGDAASEELLQVLPDVTERILSEFHHARNVSRKVAVETG